MIWQAQDKLSVQKISAVNLRAISVILLGDPQKSDGRHEGGHQRKSNWSNLDAIRDLS